MHDMLIVVLIGLTRASILTCLVIKDSSLLDFDDFCDEVTYHGHATPLPSLATLVDSIVD